MSDALENLPAKLVLHFEAHGLPGQITIGDQKARTLIDALPKLVGALADAGASAPRAADRPDRWNDGPEHEPPPGVFGDENPPRCPQHHKLMKRSQYGDRNWFCPAKVAEDDGTGRPVYCKYTVKAT
jgi:hypothetical protein